MIFRINVRNMPQSEAPRSKTYRQGAPPATRIQSLDYPPVDKLDCGYVGCALIYGHSTNQMGARSAGNTENVFLKTSADRSAIRKIQLRAATRTKSGIQRGPLRWHGPISDHASGACPLRLSSMRNFHLSNQQFCQDFRGELDESNGVKNSPV